MVDVKKILGDPALVVVFTYAPAGLGHLRVTDALFHGLPGGVNHYLLGSHDRSLSYIHRIVSIHPLGHRLMVWIQHGVAEDVFSAFYRWYLRNNTRLIFEQFTTILDQRLTIPKTVLVVATHFGLAHQLAAIKQELSRARNIKIILVVQVTDDSPQKLWYIQGADLIVVPSHRTRERFLAYARQANLVAAPIIVLPYPVSPALSRPLLANEYADRIAQLKPKWYHPMHIIIPISGAAVGQSYLAALINGLSRLSPRFSFHVVSKLTSYTRQFIDKLANTASVQMDVAGSDREVVERYEDVYKKYTIALEVTKPSEQAFKALVAPDKRGGSILLFAHPVGQQEYDNLDFLRRHHLIPSEDESRALWLGAEQEKSDQRFNSDLVIRSRLWRGLMLPPEANSAAGFIWWCFNHGIFWQMGHNELKASSTDKHSQEIAPDGVARFWQEVASYLQIITI
ncbi:hypothetical protein HY008_00300 [Candidatus Woesebacteria bacterium]|nr:hypothetical protein [Candidatus Woesebacteria bacterium]